MPNAKETKMYASHPDHPDYMHPDAPELPKRITLHRADAFATQQNQTVVVHPEEALGHSTAHKPGPLARHAMKVGLVPDGYRLVSPKSGQKLYPSDCLYDHVKEGDTVEVVKA